MMKITRTDKSNYIVYCHTNNINNKKYIGLTCQTGNSRWGSDGRNYRSGYFRNAIKKYGWDNFSHEILYEGLQKEEAIEKEVECIEIFHTQDKRFGYNISAGGSTGNGLSGKNHPMFGRKYNITDAPMYGKHHSEETKLRMSEAAKQRVGEKNSFYGKQHSEESKLQISESRLKYYQQNPPSGRKIINLDTGEIFDSLKECSKNFNVHMSNLVKVCKGIRLTTGGYRFAYVNE